MPSRFVSWCAHCKHRIEIGDIITPSKTYGRFIHEDCGDFTPIAVAELDADSVPLIPSPLTPTEPEPTTTHPPVNVEEVVYGMSRKYAQEVRRWIKFFYADGRNTIPGIHTDFAPEDIF